MTAYRPSPGDAFAASEARPVEGPLRRRQGDGGPGRDGRPGSVPPGAGPGPPPGRRCRGWSSSRSGSGSGRRAPGGAGGSPPARRSTPGRAPPQCSGASRPGGCLRRYRAFRSLLRCGWSSRAVSSRENGGQPGVHPQLGHGPRGGALDRPGPDPQQPGHLGFAAVVELLTKEPLLN